MARYRMNGFSDDQSDSEIVVATHPAPVGTFIVYANEDGTHTKTPVILWGVLSDSFVVPITLDGVWDGVTNRNNFVLHSNGYCSAFERSWTTLEEAIADMKEYA